MRETSSWECCVCLKPLPINRGRNFCPTCNLAVCGPMGMDQCWGLTKKVPLDDTDAVWACVDCIAEDP